MTYGSPATPEEQPQQVDEPVRTERSTETTQQARPESSTAPDERTVGDELTGRLESELSRARDVVEAVERAAGNVGLTTATMGGRIQCDYDLGTDDLVCRSVSFELEF